MIPYPKKHIRYSHLERRVVWGCSNGPDDDNLQMQNAKTLIETIDADLYALQEISNANLFETLVTNLEGYGRVLANFDQTAYGVYL